MTTTDSAAVRCSAWIKEQGVDPIGTAGSYAGYLLVEWPLPWPRDLSDVAELAPVHEAMAGTGLRLQGLVPIFGDQEARRVIRYAAKPGQGFRGYERAERLVPVDRVREAAIDLARGDDGDPERARAGITDDVLVCTHGKRDICCGSKGMALVKDLSTDPAWFGGSIRLWRTSHTGGHRFAPTAIVLSQGTAWAFLDADALHRIAEREGALDDLLSRYRGCAGMGSPPIQALEREAFCDVGWEWLDWSRSGEELGEGRVRVTGESPAGERRIWEGVVEELRQIPVPECGRPIEDAKKSEPELLLTKLRSAVLPRMLGGNCSDTPLSPLTGRGEGTGPRLP